MLGPVHDVRAVMQATNWERYLHLSTLMVRRPLMVSLLGILDELKRG
jgi:hypothetical protein